MNDGEETPQQKAASERKARIAKARRDLADRMAADPAGVARFNSRMAALANAARRERERFEMKVLGAPPPPAPLPPKPSGMGKAEWRIEKKRLREASVADQSLPVKWAGIQGTPETLEYASRVHDGALAQLHRNGTINAEQLEYAAQIANVHRSIESDVAVAIASLEARVDQSVRGPAVAERIHRVRMHGAYGFWRKMLPMPKALVLDMIVGDAIGYTVAAARHRVHNRKAKRYLIEAIQRWPLCVAHAFSAVDQDAVDAMNMARRPAGVHLSALPSPQRYEHARRAEAGREKTDEPYLLPPLDPIFLDDRGLLKEWKEIAAIIRERVFGDAEMAEVA
ncbi:MAG: hypothetical protein JWR10_964 [Rubritepida sp.]|nr:hypothetical protein [Rubritepida sp.]